MAASLMKIRKIKKKFIPWIIFAALMALMGTGCQRDTPPAPALSGAPHFDPDNEPNAMPAEQLLKHFGPIPKPRRHYRFAAVMKFLGNHYWQLLAEGMSAKAHEAGSTIDIRAAASESDESGQLRNMQALIALNPDVIFVSAQNNTNLTPAVQAARKKGILLIVVNDALLDDAAYFVGPNQYENGVRAARYFIQTLPAGGEAALIRGLPNNYAVKQRSQGFIDTLKNTPFSIVADEYGEWDLQKSAQISAAILKKHPKLAGFYCNSDIMALGAAYSVKNQGLTDKTIVIGTDGIGPAYDAIRAGTLTATIDSYPYQTGVIAIEVALRLLAGQKIPRVVNSPQNTINRASIEIENNKEGR